MRREEAAMTPAADPRDRFCTDVDSPSGRHLVDGIDVVRDQARDEVLEAELYPRVTPEIIAEIEETDAMIFAMVEQTTAERRERKNPDRWRNFHVDVTPLAYKIVDLVWLHEDGNFRVLAQCLVQQRLEDNQRTPTAAASPIAPVLAAMITAQIAATPAERLPF